MIVLFGVLAVMCLKGDGGEADDVSTSESSEEMEDGVVKALPGMPFANCAFLFFG